jgi:GT2 family glycosyltransferase
LGIEKAKGEIILFSQDDIWVGPKFLSHHDQAHRDFPARNVGVLGHIDWHPDLEVSDFMLWLTNGSSIFGKFGGHQFAFEKLKSKEWADYNFFYTSNISLKKEILQQERFDTDFKSYGWEDIELGYRLDRKYGLRLRYVPEAIAWHYHQIDFTSFRKRMFAIGKAAYIFDRKHPEIAKVPNFKKAVAFRILGSKLVIATLRLLAKISPKLQALYFYALSKRYFMEGIDAGRT